MNGPVSTSPPFEVPVLTYLRELHLRLTDLNEGELAGYIPELANADPSSFGIAVATPDGHVYEIGDTDRPFTVQSASKPFAFGMALDDRGLDYVLTKVGVEPSGDAFNAIVFDELSRRPFNPMVNAGAIVTSGLVAGVGRDAQLVRILEGFARFTGHEVAVDERVFSSERASGHRNRAIGHLMRAHGMLDDDVEGVLDLYFRQCSLEVSCRDLAVMAATLANRGVNPLTGTRALEERHVASVLSVMSTCGMYDYAGEWVYRIGMPAKSGVSGGLIAVLPGQLGIGVFSPRLDQRGNSVRGIAVCKELSSAFDLHLLTPHCSVRSTVRRAYGGDAVRSKRFRVPAETRVLDEQGGTVRVYELQGDLYFGSVESLTRAVATELAGTGFVILDCKRIGTVDDAAAGLVVELCRIITLTGPSVLLTNLEPESTVARTLELLRVDSPTGRGVRLVADVDAALEWCEDRLLEGADGSAEAMELVGLDEQELFAGLDECALSALEGITHLEQFEQGRTIFAKGDEADTLYLLATGSVDVLLPVPGDGRYRRLATMSPGVAFGEMAALDGGTRSATARARETSLCHVLEVASLERLCREHPDLAIGLYRNLALILSRGLRLANAEIRSLEV